MGISELPRLSILEMKPGRMEATARVNIAHVEQKALHSVKWSVLIEAVSRTANPLILLILARFLTPSDFGVIATAMIGISFAQLFADAGLSKALVQTESESREAAVVAFWLNTALGVCTYIVFFFAAPFFAEFFNVSGSSLVLRVLGLQIILASASSVQQALLVRELDFRPLFWAKFFSALVPGVFSIPLAFYGFGVWALVAGALSGQSLNLLILWSQSSWRPAMRMDLRLTKKLTGFGFWVLAEGFGAWLITWGDCLLLGKFLGVYELGVYRTGWTLVTIIFGLALNPFLPVVYSSLSRLQGDKAAVLHGFRKVNRVVIGVAMPMGIGLMLLGPEMSALLFDAKWLGLGQVLSILGLMVGLSWLVGINSQLYTAIGRPQINSKIIFMAILYYLPCYAIAAQKGLEVFLYTRLVVSLFALIIHFLVCKRMLEMSFFYIWNDAKYQITSSFAMGIALAIIKQLLYFIIPEVPPFIMLVSLFLSGVGIYLSLLWLMDQTFINQTLRLIKEAAVS